MKSGIPSISDENLFVNMAEAPHISDHSSNLNSETRGKKRDISETTDDAKDLEDNLPKVQALPEGHITLDQAKQLWDEFNSRHANLTGDKSAELKEKYHKKLTDAKGFELALLEKHTKDKLYEASNTIRKWWHKRRNSGAKIQINPNGNHTNQFHTFINVKADGSIDPKITKTLNHDRDQKLLSWFEKGDWSAFEIPSQEVLESAFSLFASGKISFHQKTTLSDIIGSTDAYGKFVAHPILDEAGNFTLNALALLVPRLVKKVPNRPFSEAELQNFRMLMMTLPKSERTFFVFDEQKLDENGSSPSKHTIMREQLATKTFDQYPIELLNVTHHTFRYPFGGNPFSGFEFLETRPAAVKKIAQYNTNTHPLSLKYQGVLKYSASVEDAMGVVAYGVDNWTSLIPRIGNQTIDDIEHFTLQNSRPTVTPDTVRLGMVDSEFSVHGSVEVYPECYAHDGYHRTTRAMIGENIRQAIEELKAFTRQTFGVKWSKDIWLLVDFDIAAFAFQFLKTEGVEIKNISKLPLDQKVKLMTTLMASVLKAPYLSNQLDNCQEKYRKGLASKQILTTLDDEPTQILLGFVIDLVMNPEKWLKYHISNNPEYWKGLFSGAHYARLLEIAHYLHEQGHFGQDMKANILFFEVFVQSQKASAVIETIFGKIFSKSWNKPSSEELQEQIMEAKQVLSSIKSYEAVRDNTTVFLGFRKKEPEAEKTSSDEAGLDIGSDLKQNVENNRKLYVQKLRSYSKSKNLPKKKR